MRFQQTRRHEVKLLIHFIAQFLRDTDKSGHDTFMLDYIMKNRPDIVDFVLSEGEENDNSPTSNS